MAFGRRGHHYTFLYLGQDILSPETVSGKVRKFRNSFSILPPDVTHRMLPFRLHFGILSRQ